VPAGSARQVAENPEQPRQHAALPIEPRRRLHGLEERRLDQILGLRPTVGHVPRHEQELSRRAVEHLGQRRGSAGAAEAGKRQILRGSMHQLPLV